MEKHYSLQKAADLLGVTTQTLRNWDNAGKINTIRTVGNQRRIPESEIIRISGRAIDNTALTKQKPQRLIVKMQEKQIISAETVEMPAVLVKEEENYLLMCRDTAVYDIAQKEVLNEKLLPGCMLKNTMDYNDWFKTRYASQTNFSAQSLIRNTFESSKYEQIPYTTRALSLSDSYWLKKQDEEVSFNDITPYIQFNPHANLFVSGKTDKKWLDSQTLLKINAFREFEPYLLCEALGLKNVTEAQATQEGMILSNFTSPDLFFESMEQYGITDEDPRDIIIEIYKEQAVALFVLDYLVENNDRHPDDYGCLRNTATGDYISMSPYHNFDWAWSGDVIALPESALRGYKGYIHEFCQWAMDIASDFEYGTIIEKRASELLVI